MQLLHFRAREVYQNVPASTCRKLAGLCMEDAIIAICILVFIMGCLLLTVGLNIRARIRSILQARRAANPPPYSSLGFPPSASRSPLCKPASPDSSTSPSFDPYRVVAPSLDSSLLLKDDYFAHIPHPDRTLAASSPQRLRPCGVGLGFGDTIQTGPAIPAASPCPADMAMDQLTPPPPVYVQDPRRGAEDASVP
ncbi:hypothetical protein B0H17DRAFT_1193461 [Mycena rosella]|uniref:Uncharacterized protein n=1 Tax=Mycena rosella TaxID=1033263 RepID=A0AAD7GTI3_MYCRO|nr:hypothetical protein B0H17DRAFT_1193461 [Mycena rosella]